MENKSNNKNYLKQYSELKKLALSLIAEFESENYSVSMSNHFQPDESFTLLIFKYQNAEDDDPVGTISTTTVKSNSEQETFVHHNFSGCFKTDELSKHFTSAELEILNKIINYKIKQK